MWDDESTGNPPYVKFPFRNYAYRKSPNGTHRSIYGDKLEKIHNFNPRDPSLFESDVPIETRILIDGYEDSDEPSKGHRVVTIDIEVSTEGGFPVIKEGDKEIINFMLDNAAILREISLRMVLKISDLRKMDPANWQALARTTCMKGHI